MPPTYSAHTIEIQYLSGTPTYIAEIIGALQLVIIPCQCIFLFIMIRAWHGDDIGEFLPKGQRERRVIFITLGVLVAVTIASMAYAQIRGFI